MKKYIILIIEEGLWGLESYLFMTNNLHRDFIERYNINWDNDSSKPFETPKFNNLNYYFSDTIVEIFSFKKSVEKDGKIWGEKMLEMDFRDEEDEEKLIQFLSENWKEIESSIDESCNIVSKFRDFKSRGKT